MQRRMMLAGLVVAFGALAPIRAGACDDDADDNCDCGDGASGRRQDETWGHFYARRQREVERQFRRSDRDR